MKKFDLHAQNKYTIVIKQTERMKILNKTDYKIAVIDYGAGNMHSVLGALARIGADAYVATRPDELRGCSGIILPGVGAFGYAMASLQSTGFADVIVRACRDGVPLLGICLGMQLLFGASEESPRAAGLGILPGKVTLLKTQGLKTPHMGWTSLSGCKGRLLSGVNDGDFVYFVHSYGVHSEGCRSAAACYGEEFDAAIECGNVFATQFHPEKSSAVGEKILRNFAHICEGVRA